MIRFPDFWMTEEEFIQLMQRIERLNLIYKGAEIREKTSQSIIDINDTKED